MAITTTEYARTRQQRLRALGRRNGPSIGALLPSFAPALLPTLLPALALLLTPGARADDWHFTPNVNMSVTQTDNVALAPRGSERSDLVTQIAPGFTAFNTDPRLKASITYALQETLYAHSGNGSNLSNLLNANVNAMLLRDLMFVDARASIGQQNISAFGPQAYSNVNATNNRTDVRTYSVSPYIVNRFGSFATQQIRYTHDAVNAGNDLLASTNTDRLQYNLNSGARYTLTNWGVQASTQKTHYSNVQTVDQSSISANAGHLLTRTVRLTGTAGYENNTYATEGEKPNGAFYTVGAIWTPTSRTNVTANVGHRYFGNTFFLSANTRARNTILSVNYSDDITSSQAQFVQNAVIDTFSQLNALYTPQIPDAATRQRFVNGLITQFNLPTGLAVPINGFTNRYFEQKTLQGSITYSGAKSTVVGTVYDTRRLPVQAGSATVVGNVLLDDNSKQQGANAFWNLKLTGRASALVNATYSRNTSLSFNSRDTYRILRVGLTSQFQPKLSGGVEFRHSLQSSSFVGGDIRENALTASLLMQF